MSENVNRQSKDFLTVLKKSVIALLISISAILLISLMLTAILQLSGQPELFYDAVSVVILALSTYITVRAYICKSVSPKVLTSMLFGVMLIAFLSLMSLIFSSSSFSMTSFLINGFVIRSLYYEFSLESRINHLGP